MRTIVIATLLPLLFWPLTFGLYSLPKTQFLALEKLYYSTDGPHWKWRVPYSSYGMPWNFSTVDANPCVHWQGISCSSTCASSPCTVELLNLPMLGLIGKLPDEIVNLSDLVYLLLNNNFLYGPIPNEIGVLGSLEYLYLYGNYFTGSIPESVGNLTSLRYLALSSNLLDGTVPKSFSKLQMVSYVDMSVNSFAGSLPEVFESLESLQLLALDNNLFTGTISSSFFNPPFLQYFDVSNNLLNGSLPSDIGIPSYIYLVSVDSNYLSSSIPASYAVSSLAQFDAHGNFFSASIPSEFQNCSQLTEFLVYSNVLTGSLPSFCDLPVINYINFEYNLFNGSIPACYGNLTTLTNLWVGDNFLTGQIPEELYSISYLEVLVVANNSLTGTISNNVNKWTFLQGLELLLNDFTGTLPSSLSTLTFLSTLDLKGNRFNGTIPNEFGNVTSMQYLYLSANEFTGTIPASLGNLYYMVEMWLDSNFFHGPIPGEIGKLTNLQELWLHENSLSMQIPSHLGGLISLTQLEVDHNLFSGTIPYEFGLLTNLTVLGADFNMFNGSLPPSLGNLERLVSFIINDNFLSGSIPSSFQNLEHLTYLSLYDNLLTGTIPDSMFSNMIILSSLWLDNNYFRGNIPSSLGDAVGISQIYLQQNFLSGSFLDTLSNLTNTQYLMLYANMFSGTIPNMFQTWLNLQYFSVYNNFFSGSIPDSLSASRIGALSMNLDENYFSGTIPDKIAGSGKLSFFSASLNCISGSISSSWCSNTKMITFVLDGVHASPHCSKLVFPIYPNSAYLVSNSFSGTIPSCLFNLSSLQTIHLSGNNIYGTLPTLRSSVLQNLDVSHNVLTGTIPLSIWSYPFLSLDVSFNRLTGLIPSDSVYNYSANTSSLAAQVNRLSGNLPAAWKASPNVQILEGNMFSCVSSFSAETINLPTEDPDATRYQCGSLYTNYSLLIALVLTVMLAAIVGLVFCAPYGLQSLTAQTKCFCCTSVVSSMCDSLVTVRRMLVTSYLSILHPTSRNARWSNLRHWASDMQELYKLLAGLVLLLWIIGVPLYAAMSHTYGTYTEQYVWSISLTFIGGIAPTIAILVFLLLLMEVIVLYAQCYRPELWKEHFLSSDHLQKQWIRLFHKGTTPTSTAVVVSSQNPLHGDIESSTTTTVELPASSSAVPAAASSSSPSKLKETWKCWTPTSRIWTIRTCCVVLNMIIVLTVNAAYIIAIETQPDFFLLTILSLLVSLFKVLWNNSIICNNVLGQRIVGHGHNNVLFDASVQVMLVVSNNILAPLIAAQVVSSSCFQYAVSRPPVINLMLPSSACYFYEVNVDYGVSQNFTCASVSDLEASLGATVTVLDSISTGEGGSIQFYPGFSYNFQCSSALLQAFMYIFVMRFIFSAMILPMMLGGAKIFQQYLFRKLLDKKLLLVIPPLNDEDSSSSPATAVNTSTTTTTTTEVTSFLFRFVTAFLPPILRAVSLPQEIATAVNTDASDAEAHREMNQLQMRHRLCIWAATNASILSPLTVDDDSDGLSRTDSMDSTLSDSSSPGNSGRSSRSSKKEASTGSTAEANAATPLYLAKTLRVRIISDVAVLLSFGVLFPPLAVLILLAVCVDVTVTMLMVGRLLQINDALSRLTSMLFLSPMDTTNVDKDNRLPGEAGDGTENVLDRLQSVQKLVISMLSTLHHSFRKFYLKLWRGIVTVCYLAGLLWGFALFDVLGNTAGTEQSIWIVLFTVSSPAWLSLIVNPLGCGFYNIIASSYVCRRFVPGLGMSNKDKNVSSNKSDDDDGGGMNKDSREFSGKESSGAKSVELSIRQGSVAVT